MARRVMCMLLTLVMVLSIVPTAAFAAEASADSSANQKAVEICRKVGDSMLENAKTTAPGFGTGWGEWTMLCLARTNRLWDAEGQKIIDQYCTKVLNDSTFARIKENGQIHRYKSTENSRLIMGLTAVGRDVPSFWQNSAEDGTVTTLLTPLEDLKWLPKQGINGPIWALIALDTMKFPTESETFRQELVDWILGKALADGGWALGGTKADPDMTGMALQALAPYKDQTEVAQAGQKAFEVLSALQQADGGFASWGTVNSESIAQVVVAATTWGIDPNTDTRFVKDGISAVDALCGFAVEDAQYGWGFRHVMDQGYNGMATDQGMYALAAYNRLVNGETGLYDMTDVPVIQQIAAIGEVTLDKAEQIAEARSAKNALGRKVYNEDVLTAAEAKLAEMQQAAAASVIQQIAAIGEVTPDKENAIQEARKAYNGLDDACRQLVTNADVLAEAETVLGILKTPAADTLSVFNKAGDVQMQTVQQQGSEFGYGNEWYVIGLARAYRDIPEVYYTNLEKYLTESGEKALEKITEVEKMILAVTAIGKDPANVAGKNLLACLADAGTATKSLNGTIYALLALDSKDYEIPAAPDGAEQTTRATLINTILNSTLENGGWNWGWGDQIEWDLSGMAIQALAPYYDVHTDGVEDGAVKKTVDAALNLISKGQLPGGGFESWGSESPESDAQILVALTALGIDPDTDSRFIKNGRTVVNALCTFALEDGSFHPGFNNEPNVMSTNQAHYALAAYYRFRNGETSLYDMTDAGAEEHVSALIADIGKVTAQSAEAVKAARAAYEALCPALQTKVKNYDVLLAAESMLEHVNNADSMAELTENQEIMNDVLTEEEKALVAAGAPVQVYLEQKELSDRLSAEDQVLVNKVLKNNAGTKAGLYLDINLIKQVGSSAVSKVSGLSNAVTIAVQIPERLRNENKDVERVYSMLRIHDGKADILDGTFDEKTGVFTFATNLFSTYVLTYRDKPVKQDVPETNPDTVPETEVTPETEASHGSAVPETGDSFHFAVPTGFMVISGIAMIAVLELSKKKESM